MSLCRGRNEKYHNSFFLSPNCKEKDCSPLKNKFVSREHNSAYGSPGHSICYRLKGIPKIIEFKDGKFWRDDSICEFKTGEIISTSFLLNFWR